MIGRASVNATYFHGDMAEVLIYNGALSGEEIASVNTYLGGKYSIDVDAQPVNLVDSQPRQQMQSVNVDRKPSISAMDRIYFRPPKRAFRRIHPIE